MPLRAIGFSIIFVYLAFGALVEPVLGILGYMAIYMIGAEKQWWHAVLNPLGIRYSLTFAALTAIGILLNRHKLKFKKLLLRQEILALILLLWIWVLHLLGAETVNRYAFTDPPAIKLTKVMFFILMLTHVVTKPKDINKVVWLFVICAFMLGLQAYGLPRSAYIGGRLDGRVGGSDFLDSNALAAFMVASSVIIGSVFMRTAWWGKIICGAAGAFALNTIVLCRSRGAVLALVGAGVAIIALSPRHIRGKMIAGALVALLGLAYVSDAQFLARMANIGNNVSSAVEAGQTSDMSTNMRLAAWRGGFKMFKAHPLGVGAGNFNQYIGYYSSEVEGLSPHSTYVQAIAELGFPGLILVLALFINGGVTTLKVLKDSHHLSEPDRSILQWSSLGFGAVIVGYATCGLTAHLLYYEAFWWFLLMPVCLQRASENAHEEYLLTMPSVDTNEPDAVQSWMLK